MLKPSFKCIRIYCRKKLQKQLLGITVALGNTLIFIDINGPKGPNVLNKDFWIWLIWDDGTIRDQYSEDLSNLESDFNACKNGEIFYGCFAKFLTNSKVLSVEPSLTKRISKSASSNLVIFLFSSS